MTPTPLDAKPQGAQLKIESDKDYSRDYIPLSSNWEVQTKGRGSSFRIAERKPDGERFLINEQPYLYERLERMAREVNAERVEAAERIEKLEKQNATIIANASEIAQNQANYLLKLQNDLRRIEQERDAALRALAEARRDAERLDWLESNCFGHAYPRGKPYAMVRIFIKHDREEQKFLQCSASNGVGRVSLRTAIDAASQPEKDANNE